MKIPLIFGTSTTIMRGLRLAPLQGGLFLCPETRYSVLISSGPSFYRAFKKRKYPRKCVVDSDNLRVAFLSAYVNYTHHEKGFHTYHTCTADNSAGTSTDSRNRRADSSADRTNQKEDRTAQTAFRPVIHPIFSFNAAPGSIPGWVRYA